MAACCCWTWTLELDFPVPTNAASIKTPPRHLEMVKPLLTGAKQQSRPPSKQYGKLANIQQVVSCPSRKLLQKQKGHSSFCQLPGRAWGSSNYWPFHGQGGLSEQEALRDGLQWLSDDYTKGRSLVWHSLHKHAHAPTCQKRSFPRGGFRREVPQERLWCVQL